jgi:hypothetical protein
MVWAKYFLCVVLSVPACMGFSQKIVYSEPEREDSRRLNFEIIGKINGNFLVYKNIRNKHSIVVLDKDMKQIAKEEQDYIPDDNRVINVDFFSYPDFSYLIYQYQKKNIVYCMGVKLDGMGKRISDVMQLDTTQLGFAMNNRIYTVLSSENKDRIMVFKINSKNRSLYRITTLLFTDKLELLRKDYMALKMEERNDYLGQFYLDNDGDLVFAKFYRSTNDNIEKASMIIKPSQKDSLEEHEIKTSKLFLDEIHIKVDNAGKRYLLASMFFKQRRSNTDGLFFNIWDKQAGRFSLEDTITFSDELRKEARGESAVRTAFNDHFIRTIIPKRDGGFLLTSESYYTTSRYNTWNRYNYMYGSPFYNPADYYYYSPYGYNSLYWNSRMNSSQSLRYHADNIVVFSVNGQGKLEWTNVISKSQIDDESDDAISFQVMNTGGQLHFLFNQQEKRLNLLNDYTISPGGQLNRNPTLKNLDRGYDFLPKYAKQVSARQMIIPCIYRNSICFALVDYSDN